MRLARNSSREHPHHDLAVLEHVADARGRAAVVLEHEEVLGPGAHQVDADDVAVDPGRRVDADHRRLVGLVAVDEVGRDDAGPDDLGAVVDVVEEGVERPRPLLHPALELAPLGLGEHPRHHVEGDQPLGVAALAVDREGDADAPEQRLGLVLLLGEHLGRGAAPPSRSELGIGGTDRVAVEHLVEGADPRLPRARPARDPTKFDGPAKTQAGCDRRRTVAPAARHDICPAPGQLARGCPPSMQRLARRRTAG